MGARKIVHIKINESFVWNWNFCPIVVHFVQSLGRVRLFVIPWTAARQAFLSCTISQSLLKLTSIESVMQFNPLILCFLFYFGLQAFPASGSFPMSQFFTSGHHIIKNKASLVAQLVKNPPAMQETWVRSLGWEDPLEKGKAPGDPTPVFWPREFHGLNRPWDAKSRT